MPSGHDRAAAEASELASVSGARTGDALVGGTRPQRGGLDYAPDFAEIPGSFGASDRGPFCISAAIT